MHKDLAVDAFTTFGLGESFVDSIAKFLEVSVPRYRFHFFAAAVFSFI